MSDVAYRARMDGVPPLAEMMTLIEAKEIERPGVACTWIRQFQRFMPNYAEWLLDILERSPTPEAYTPYFPVDLAFLAHEMFSNNPTAIRRLINTGRVDIACAAASDIDERIIALEPLLIEIGNGNDLEIVRLASWHLAYHYHYLHPRGAAAGYVEQIELPEIDLFLLFGRHQEIESPYGTVIYPKKPCKTLSREAIDGWIDRLFPKLIRGGIREGLNYSWSSEAAQTQTTEIRYQSGFVSYKSSLGSINEIYYATIGYRSNVLWDPRQFIGKNSPSIPEKFLGHDK